VRSRERSLGNLPLVLKPSGFPPPPSSFHWRPLLQLCLIHLLCQRMHSLLSRTTGRPLTAELQFVCEAFTTLASEFLPSAILPSWEDIGRVEFVDILQRSNIFYVQLSIEVTSPSLTCCIQSCHRTIALRLTEGLGYLINTKMFVSG
jgi:hypothetical protein